MIAKAFQPPYGYEYDRADSMSEMYTDFLDSCTERDDIIVLPEYSDVPVKIRSRETLLSCYERFGERLYIKARETAKRCKAHVFLGGVYDFSAKGNLRNSIIAFDRKGNEAGRYFKQHLVPREMNIYELDKDYSFEFCQPEIVEMDGIKYAFMICYDCYFYEMLSNIGRYDPDVLIMSAYQRSDTHETLATMTKFAAYNTNTYVIRSSVSLGEKSLTGGSSMIVSPEGLILADAYSKVGAVEADIDPHKRFLKPAGFGNPPAPHHKYIEKGRRPWKYRPAGSFVARDNQSMDYPRICYCPDSSMASFGAYVGMGAKEILFSLCSKNGETVLFGAEEGEVLPSFEEILKKFSCHTIMNVWTDSAEENELKSMAKLVKKYDCEKYIIWVNQNPKILQFMKNTCPCSLCLVENVSDDIIEEAVNIGAERVLFLNNDLENIKNTAEKCHEKGLKCAVLSPKGEETKCFDLGADVAVVKDFIKIYMEK